MPVVVENQFDLEKKFQSSAALFKALAHPLRLKLVCGLLKAPCTQTSISRLLDIPQSSLAQHLAVLRREGIVVGRRDKGAEVMLEVVDPRVEHIFKQVCGGEDFSHYEWEAKSEN
jgi:DNA-binding transcriptional ArsR family regulator